MTVRPRRRRIFTSLVRSKIDQPRRFQFFLLRHFFAGVFFRSILHIRPLSFSLRLFLSLYPSPSVSRLFLTLCGIQSHRFVYFIACIRCCLVGRCCCCLLVGVLMVVLDRLSFISSRFCCVRAPSLSSASHIISLCSLGWPCDRWRQGETSSLPSLPVSPASMAIHMPLSLCTCIPPVELVTLRLTSFLCAVRAHIAHTYLPPHLTLHYFFPRRATSDDAPSSSSSTILLCPHPPRGASLFNFK